MKFPHFLTKGSKIGLVATAGKTNKETIDRAVAIIENRGYKVLVANHALDSYYQMAGTDTNRVSDLQEFIDRPDIEAIFCIRGGYGTIRIIDQIDFSLFKSSPKWIVGFSDITILHAYLQNQLSIASIHGLMPINYKNPQMPDLDMLFNYLEGKTNNIKLHSHQFNKEGSASGELAGGNLTILNSLRGTDLDFDPKNKILFIEDVGDYLYRIDRMIHTLKIGHVFENIKGMIVGQFTDMLDNKHPFGKDAYEIIQNVTRDYNFPILFNFPAGHCSPNYPLILGKMISIDVNSKGATINYI